MRITVILASGKVSSEEVIAEPFGIDGCDEKFAVHRSIGDGFYGSPWTATHVETGLCIAHGDTIDGTIEAGRAAWKSRTPEEIAAVKARRATEIALLRAKAGGLQ